MPMMLQSPWFSETTSPKVWLPKKMRRMKYPSKGPNHPSKGPNQGSIRSRNNKSSCRGLKINVPRAVSATNPKSRKKILLRLMTRNSKRYKIRSTPSIKEWLCLQRRRRNWISNCHAVWLLSSKKPAKPKRKQPKNTEKRRRAPLNSKYH